MDALAFFNKAIDSLIEFCKTKLTAATAEAIAWVGLILIHASALPSVVSLMAGVNDKMPSIDMVLFTWVGLTLFFIRAAVMRNMLYIITIGLGFIVHALLLAFLVFK